MKNTDGRPPAAASRAWFQWLLARSVTLTWAYGTVLGLWLLLRFVLGDFSWWSFAFNSMLMYAFAPAPLVLAVAVLTRRREVWATFVVSAALWAWLWGGLFVPRLRPAQAAGPSLTVMTYNVLGFNSDTRGVLDTIRASNADVLGLQELNPEIAAAIERELSGEYPHQWLMPEPGVTGGGLLSRYPFERAGAAPLDTVQWVSPPMVVTLAIEGRAVTLVRFHASAQAGLWRERERQAALLAEFAKAHSGALIALGDLNATDQNDAYALTTRSLRDAWREAGWGFGHTFPGADARVSPGSSRPSFGGFAVPQWLVRIDFIFHSAELAAHDARLGRFDGMSDHRPVMATLAFR